jgi:hypothetical protein
MKFNTGILFLEKSPTSNDEKKEAKTKPLINCLRTSLLMVNIMVIKSLYDY